MLFNKNSVYLTLTIVIGLSVVGLGAYFLFPQSQTHNYPPEPFTPVKDLMLWEKAADSDFASAGQANEVSEDIPTFSNIASSLGSQSLIENR